MVVEDAVAVVVAVGVVAAEAVAAARGGSGKRVCAGKTQLLDLPREGQFNGSLHLHSEKSYPTLG